MSDGPKQIAFKEYEVEVTLIVTAPHITEARESLGRSGVAVGQMIGETTIDDVRLWGRDDDE